jgi:SAM-dependent methyltransferase
MGARPTVLDISAKALSVSQARLGLEANGVTWIHGDLRTAPLAKSGFDLWHDRAVLHFLTDPADQAIYVRRLRESLCPGGHAVIGVFSHDAPPRCSALDLRRYDIGELAELLGPEFRLIEEAGDPHVTPSGLAQPYTYGLFQLGPGA